MRFRKCFLCLCICSAYSFFDLSSFRKKEVGYEKYWRFTGLFFLKLVFVVACFTFLLPLSIHAVPCIPGTDCIGMPPSAGPLEFRIDTAGNKHSAIWEPSWTSIDFDIVGDDWWNPGFQSDKVDPSYGDDSFYYYLNINKYRKYYNLEFIFQVANDSCEQTLKGGYEREYTHSSSYTHFEESSVHSEFSTKLTGHIGEIGSKVGASTTIGDSWTETTGIKETYKIEDLECCSTRGWWNQYFITEIVLDIGYQEDHVGYWEDLPVFDGYLVDKQWMGPWSTTVSGTCVPLPPPIPEPATVLLLGTGFLGLLSFKKKKKV